MIEDIIFFEQCKMRFAPEFMFVSQNINTARLSWSLTFLTWFAQCKWTFTMLPVLSNDFHPLSRKKRFFLQECTEPETTEMCICIIMYINLLTLKGLTCRSIREKFITAINFKELELTKIHHSVWKWNLLQYCYSLKQTIKWNHHIVPGNFA